MVICHERIYLIVSILSNLSILFVFKYYNLFATTISSLLQLDYVSSSSVVLHVLLPVGISFYTFQTLSYTIDVYRGITKTENNYLKFSLYVSFFPQLVAGPIERSSHLLPQINFPKYFSTENFYFGILWP